MESCEILAVRTADILHSPVIDEIMVFKLLISRHMLNHDKTCMPLKALEFTAGLTFTLLDFSNVN